MTSERCQGCGGTGFYAPGPLGRDACLDCGGTGQAKRATQTAVAVAWLDAFGKPHRCRQDAINDFGYEPEPLYRATGTDGVAGTHERQCECMDCALARGVTAAPAVRWQVRQREGGDGLGDCRRWSEWRDCSEQEAKDALEKGEPWDARSIPAHGVRVGQGGGDGR